MPYSTLTDEQIQTLVNEQPNLLALPGVALVWLEYIDPHRTELAVAVSVYAGDVQRIGQLPVTVAGLPVIVKVEDRRTCRVLEVIDPPGKRGRVAPKQPSRVD